MKSPAKYIVPYMNLVNQKANPIRSECDHLKNYPISLGSTDDWEGKARLEYMYLENISITFRWLGFPNKY